MLISIITPVLNEEDSIALFVDEINRIFGSLDHDHEIVFVDDGSTDGTAEAVVRLKKRYTYIRLLKLSRNFGKEAALTAGIDHALGDAVIPMDVDLQDPPSLLPTMIEVFESGYDVVLAKRVDRNSDSRIKRITALLFYKLIARLSASTIPENVGDFRMVSRKVVDSLKQMNETQRFMKGILSWPGYKTTYVEYSRPVRSAGHTKFNGKKLFTLAMEGITSFSYLPLRIWSFVGAFISVIAFLYATFIVVRTLVFGIDLPGYASLLVAVLFLGGVQLTVMGFLGEYIGRIYMEVKRRPIYLIDEEL